MGTKLEVGDVVEVWHKGQRIDLREAEVVFVDDYFFEVNLPDRGIVKYGISWMNHDRIGWRLKHKASPAAFPPDWVPEVGEEFEIFMTDGKWVEVFASHAIFGSNIDTSSHITIKRSSDHEILGEHHIDFLRLVARPLAKPVEVQAEEVGPDGVVSDKDRVILDQAERINDLRDTTNTQSERIKELQAEVERLKSANQLLVSTNPETRNVVAGDVVVWTQGSEQRKDWVIGQVKKISGLTGVPYIAFPPLLYEPVMNECDRNVTWWVIDRPQTPGA